MSLLSIILIFGVTILMGVLSVVLSKVKIRKECKYFETFVEHVTCFFSPKSSQKNVSEQINYILENYQEVSHLAGEDEYVSPISKLGATLANGNSIDSNLHTRIVASKIKFDGAKDREDKQLSWQFFNPFTLLYRGVELVMDFMFGYIIRKFNPGFDRETSIVWKVLNALITVLGSVASIISFLNHN